MSRIRISRGPKLRSRSPIETASNPSAGRSLIHELDPVPACSFVTSATAESPRRHVPYRKKPASGARQLVFYVLKVSFPRAIVMKTDRVFKRAFNETLDLVSKLEDGGWIPSESTLSAQLNVSRTTVRKILAALSAHGVVTGSAPRRIVATAGAEKSSFSGGGNYPYGGASGEALHGMDAQGQCMPWHSHQRA